jgi:chromosome segregation protein
MLKRLELVGFKSFADKTQFDFPAGITAIVGPNGSGKSNIVDAVRWVLGEQSAKSLRGDEMADVIFNGSTTRRSFSLAEVTMTFDNSRRILNTESDEVQIGRRVYRDGEGEYLINQQPARLKDIKELFLGSGAGTEAYGVIEQGKVDILLQASTRDRRAIFEEAAGISRFKARKVETLRKLEKVQLNLQRLQDILEEVEKQLRSVRLQASKAQRYQEYSDRLRELRVALGLSEYHELVQQLQVEAGQLDDLRQTVARLAHEVQASETEIAGLEEALAGLDDSLHKEEASLAQARAQIATSEASLAHEGDATTDLETGLGRLRVSLADLNGRLAQLAEAAAAATREVNSAEQQYAEHGRGLEKLESDLQAIARQLEQLQQASQADKAEHLEQMRRSARLQNDVVTCQAQRDQLLRERERLRQKSDQSLAHLASLDIELKELNEADSKLQSRLIAARQTLGQHQQDSERLGRLQEQTGELVAELRAERRGLVARIDVLEGLERSHEGLGTGVREVFALREQPDPGPWATVLGMVADFLKVPRQYASLIDLALGDRAQYFLVRDLAVVEEALGRRTESFSGRVTFMPISASAPRPNPSAGQLDFSPLSQVRSPLLHGEIAVPPGVATPAERFVTCEHPELAHFPAQLLSRTLIVRDLATARRLAAQSNGYRFLTLAGELREPDGTLTAGKHHAEGSLLSRKSELRELRDQAGSLDLRIAESERDLADLRDRLAVLDGHASLLNQEIGVLAEQAADLRSRLNQHRERRDGLHEEVALSRSEMSGLDQEIERLARCWQEAQDQAKQAEERVEALQARLGNAEQGIRNCEEQRQLHQQQILASRVKKAQVEERLTALRSEQNRLDHDLRQRRAEQSEEEQELATLRRRLAESQRAMLEASSALAFWYLRKEQAEHHLAGLGHEREQRRAERQTVLDRLSSLRTGWRQQQEQAHARELTVNDLRHRSNGLVERLREDYQVDLAERYQTQLGGNEAGPPTLLLVSNADQANEEIAELRRKLTRLGSVNLDSLAELAELEARAGNLKRQFDDLSAAKRSLEEIIAKINQDSKRLFLESFADIRVHFQELFRKLFGGGMADVILEDESDVLESGIDIIARPPGKELRSISLLSGGEKTLTAVALLLAVFRSKPSPFCILDEVDAALDETNIGRFTAVLREFLDQSQFVIITHSKRTMAIADVLYGITMQESGISKRVAVRFEDWPEEAQEAEPAAKAS